MMKSNNPEETENPQETQHTLNGTEQFDLLRNYLDKKFGEQKEELENKLKQQQTQNNKNYMKVSAKPESSKQFKFKGNQIQFEFNQKLSEDLDDVIDLIQDGSVSRSSKRLGNIKQELLKRNKLIKMADRSPAGWATVEEYLSDELASNSDDEKRIKSAESKALAKKKSKVRPKTFFPPRFNPMANQLMSLSQPSTNHFQPARMCFPREPAQPSGSISNNNQPFFNHQLRFPSPKSMCFSCGKTGHWRKDCPNITSHKQA